MKFDFSKLKASMLDGTPVNNIVTGLANNIYLFTKDLGLLAVAQEMYKGGVVEITVEQIQGIKQVLEDERAGYVAFVKKAVIDFLDNPEVEAKKK
jgi:hypothetical protein